MNNIIFKIRSEVEESFSKDSMACHDIEHVFRVVKLAGKIGRAEGCDMEILLAAAYMHDLGRPHEFRDPSICHAKKSVELAKPILEKVGFPAGKIPAVLHAIECHRYSSGKIPGSLEGKILQDADRLDVLGAVGIIRVFMYNGLHKRPAYNREDPFRRKSQPDDTCALDHFYQKILKLRDTLHTKTAREMAAGRDRFVKGFLAELENEIGGKK